MSELVAMLRRMRRDDVYRTYWFFATERQRIFERRLAGDRRPWTDDPILALYRFTNAWRASDRVTQFLIGAIYAYPQMPADDLLVRIVLARLFSKPSTWFAIEQRLGPICRTSLDDPGLPVVLAELQAAGPIYTSAFILSGNKAYGHNRKCLNHLALVRDMLCRRLPRTIARARGLRDIYDALRAYPLVGPFMAYQLAVDINYSELIDFSENEFTVAGPGAERGIWKAFPRATRREMSGIIMRMVENQEAACLSLGLAPPALFGRPLSAIDCQSLFCELDKYARVRFPELRSNRSRIKARFVPNAEPIHLFYPPKWGINDRLPEHVRGSAFLLAETTRSGPPPSS